MYAPQETQSGDTPKETRRPRADLLLGSVLLVMDAVMIGMLLYLLASALIHPG